MNSQSHWEDTYRSRAADEVSWYQATPVLSLELIEAAGLSRQASIIDVGGGVATLLDELLDRGYEHLALVDVAESAVTAVRDRLGDRGRDVEWFVADITEWDPPHRWDLWHDRAVFHFQVDSASRQGYLNALERGVAPGGWAMIATFDPEGPERCSGLPVCRYSADELASVLGSGWVLRETRSEVHETPAGKPQSFVFSLFARS
jgi:SAM-dependent methyltransferase